MRIKRVIESLRTFKSRRIWAEGIVVFADQNADLNVSNPTLPILKIGELPSLIVTRKSRSPIYSSRDRIDRKRDSKADIGHSRISAP